MVGRLAAVDAVDGVAAPPIGLLRCFAFATRICFSLSQSISHRFIAHSSQKTVAVLEWHSSQRRGAVDFVEAVDETVAVLFGADTAAGAVVVVGLAPAGGGYGTRLWLIFFTNICASLSQSVWHSLRLHSAQ